jgi:hypothetical protein
MKIIGDKAIFSTGKELYAFSGIIGISPILEITYGYDGGYYLGEENDFFKSDLTSKECIEMAEYMIEKWQEFRTKYEKEDHC